MTGVEIIASVVILFVGGLMCLLLVPVFLVGLYAWANVSLECWKTIIKGVRGR